MGESPAECEVAYETALYMLYAIIDDSNRDNEAVKEEDRATVDRCTLMLVSSSSR